MGEALMHMTSGRLGLCVAVENDNIVGIVTDGDIRRAMEKFGDNFFQHTVAEVMTSHPKSVSSDTKVVKIDEMMKQHKIHSVLVVNEHGNLLGIVDSFCTML